MEYLSSEGDLRALCHSGNRVEQHKSTVDRDTDESLLIAPSHLRLTEIALADIRRYMSIAQERPRK